MTPAAMTSEEFAKKAREAVAMARLGLVQGRLPHVAPGNTDEIIYPTATASPAGFLFFGALAMRLDVVACWDIDTAATDGRRLLYNPSFVMSLHPGALFGVVAHEVMHCALQHITRRGGRDPRLWNIACDLALNTLVLSSGLWLPVGALVVGQGPFADFPVGKSAEEYYDLLLASSAASSGSSGEGDESADPGKCGGVLDASSPDEAKAQWKQAIAEAKTHAQRLAGKLPGDLGRVTDDLVAPVVDWRRELRDFVSAYARDDYSWRRPNRRLLPAGLYLPGVFSETLGDIVVCVDTSGSISQHDLTIFASEMEGIATTFGCRMSILYHDTRVAHVQHWTPTDGPLKLEARGGGGTSHVEVLHQADAYDPRVIVAFTDLYSSFPSDAPGAPLIWVVVGNDNPHPPGYGRVVVIPPSSAS